MRSAIVCFLTLLLQCTHAVAGTTPPTSQTIFGLSEQVFIRELGVSYPAKIDTGARSTSINAINIQVRKDKKSGDGSVSFDLVLPDNSLKAVTMPLAKHIRIKRRASDYDEDQEKDYSRRPVIELTLCIGKQQHRVYANLADRRNFSKPMLIGSRPLQKFNALVDARAEQLQGSPRCDSNNTTREPSL
ncbi:MAG: ATP-dependent zinc protease family protein [Spongiibacteraceae bacterium]